MTSEEEFNLRLECLRMAIQTYKGTGSEVDHIVKSAQEFYDFALGMDERSPVDQSVAGE